VKRLLARGGFGVVYEAERGGLRAAVKVAHRDFAVARARLQVEGTLLRKVGPPHVPEIYETGTLGDGTPYLVMEYISDPRLADHLAEIGGPMLIATLSRFADALLDALGAVHAHGIIHRDLKPENIFLRLDPPHAYLIDLGIAKQGSTSAPVSLTQEGEVLGTAVYMSPEQCMGESDVGPATDIYALGVILYEMATGRPPFFGGNAAVRQAHVESRPPRPSRLSSAAAPVEEAILKCLAKAPADRFDSVEAVRQALREGLSRQVEVTTSATTTPIASAGREQRSVALVFFESGAAWPQVKALIEGFGGTLVHSRESAFVALFGSKGGDPPTRRALALAQALVVHRLTDRARVDLANVTLVSRPGAPPRYMSPIFERRDRLPQPSDPSGVLLSEAAAALLVGIAKQIVKGRILVTADDQNDSEETTASEIPFVGREEEMTCLLGTARAAFEQNLPTIATVLSECGYGKSRLAADLQRRLIAKLPALSCVFLRPRDPTGRAPDEPLRLLLERVLRLPPIRPEDGGRALLAERLGESGSDLWVGVALALGWKSLDDPEVRALVVAPGALRDAAVSAVGQAIRLRAREGPLAIVLDDAHFAGLDVLDGLEFASLREEKLPLWICALARPALESMRPQWATRAGHALTIRLGALDPNSAAHLCRELLRPANDVALPVIERLVARTQGNPLQLVELARGLKEEGLIRRHSKGESYYLATDELNQLPNLPVLEWLALRELEALPPKFAAHARLLSHLGQEFEGFEVEGVIRMLEPEFEAAFPADSGVALDRLLAAGLLKSHQGRLSFRNAVLRDAIGHSVPTAVSRAIHGAAFRYYDAASAIPTGELLPKVAEHAAKSGLREDAVRAYLQLAQLAQARHACLEAEEFYSCALEQMNHTDDPRRLGALHGRGLMRHRLWRYGDALADLSRALTAARERNDASAEIDLLLDQAMVLDWIEDFRKMRSCTEEAVALAEKNAVTSPQLEARLKLALGRVYWRFSRDQEAAEHLAAAASIADTLGDAAYETHVLSLIMLGFVLATLGRLDESERTFCRVVPLCEEHGDKLHLGAAIANRAMLWAHRNDKAKLLADLERLLSLAREIGNWRIEQQAHFHLALFRRWLGDADSAERDIRCAIELEDRHFGANARPESRLLLARILVARGEMKAAAAVLDSIRVQLERARAEGNQELDLVPAEKVLFTMVELATRGGTEEEWETLITRAQEFLAGGQPLIELFEVAGLSALRMNRPLAAKQAFLDAWRIAVQVPNVMRERIAQYLASLGQDPA
jgi:tetratricopeptide (TPR) repeat protein/predicted Ser/Thr protein kinase